MFLRNLFSSLKVCIKILQVKDRLIMIGRDLKKCIFVKLRNMSHENICSTNIHEYHILMYVCVSKKAKHNKKLA